MGGAGSVGGPQITDVSLEKVLLSAAEINGIMNSTRMRVSGSSQRMSDNSDAVFDIDCLGAIYGAEEVVYQGSGWTDVRDQVLQEPGSDNDHWVEQIAVLYPSAAKAQKFVDESRDVWDECAGSSIDIDKEGVDSTWDLAGADTGGAILTQNSTQRYAGGWGCQHALTSTGNVVVEAWACSHAIGSEARTIVEEMVRKATG